MPKMHMSKATCGRCDPWLASKTAAPSVGPMHGLQTSPNATPMTNCSLGPLRLIREMKELPAFPIPYVFDAKRFCRLADISANPSALLIAAPVPFASFDPV